MRIVDRSPAPPTRARSLSESRRDRSYGSGSGRRQIIRAAVCGLALVAGTLLPSARATTPVNIVALGDSLTAGLGLPERDGFVPRLQAALLARGIAANIVNAGVSGDTASGGAARLDWSVPEGTDAVILELGANDMLRGIKSEITREALDTILRRLTERHIAVLLCGMRAAPNLGTDFGQAFERIYPELASKYAVLLYPFFLDGVAADLSLVQRDGLHPNAAGVDAIVARILPQVEALIARARSAHPT
jgi:acyl-CoA thioesterase-1